MTSMLHRFPATTVRPAAAALAAALRHRPLAPQRRRSPRTTRACRRSSRSIPCMDMSRADTPRDCHQTWPLGTVQRCRRRETSQPCGAKNRCGFPTSIWSICSLRDAAASSAGRTLSRCAGSRVLVGEERIAGHEVEEARGVVSEVHAGRRSPRRAARRASRCGPHRVEVLDVEAVAAEARSGVGDRAEVVEVVAVAHVRDHDPRRVDAARRQRRRARSGRSSPARSCAPSPARRSRCSPPRRRRGCAARRR